MATTPQVQTYDYALFGEVERKPFSRIRQVIARRLSASWAEVPHVAQFDECDMGALNAMQRELATAAAEQGIKLTLLAFVMKACANALKTFPEFNASLDTQANELVLKKYCHIAFAADTPIGLLAPVVRDAGEKSLLQIAASIQALADKARAGKLAMSDAEGACFTITNLGKLGGTGFTPIINAPEVGILGLGRATPRVVEVNGAFTTRQMLPLTLVYDHRVIDGAVGGRFLAHVIAQLLEPTRLLP